LLYKHATIINDFAPHSKFALEMQHQLAKVALAHKIKQTNPQQQQKAPMRQAITEYRPTWQGLLPQKQKKRSSTP